MIRFGFRSKTAGLADPWSPVRIVNSWWIYEQVERHLEVEVLEQYFHLVT